jgi:dienelactone hydrolase
MFDPTMKQAVPASVLQNNVWNLIVEHAGAFIAVHDIENLMADGYYICLITSQHETRGVTLRVVFSENGLVSGLFIDDYPTITEKITEHEGFTDFAIVIGEGTDFLLNGTLSIPDNLTGKVPGVVLVHGSGPQDMDETIYANKPFLEIAEYLASEGIAVIRYDKRTFAHGAKMVQILDGNLTVKEETIEDAILAAEILKFDARIDENKIFILGHSLGGMLATRIHADGGNFAGIISLAGSPRLLLDIMYDQQMAYIEEMPEGDEKAAALSEMETYDEQVDILMNLSDDEARNTPMEGGIFVYYYKEMAEHQVSEYIKDIAVPFLILQGSKDFQVYADKDFVMWQELLKGRPNVTFNLYDGLNHLFMTSAGKNITEYQEEYKIKSHVDTQVLIDIVEWIKSN